MIRFEYMVIYTIKDQEGHGRICITTDKKIEGYNDVENLDKVIKKKIGIDVFVIDFKLLRTYNPIKENNK